MVDSGPEEYQRTWQQYINAFAEALIAAGADDAASPAGKRVVSHQFQCWPAALANYVQSLRTASLPYFA